MVPRRQFEARRPGQQRQPVRPVPVDLVGAHEKEPRRGRVGAHRFEQAEGRCSVNGEVGHRIARRPVVRRLGCGVQHHADTAPEPAEERVDRRCVADVEIVVAVARVCDFQLGAHRRGAGLGPEEPAPAVVVDPDDVEAERRKPPRRGRPDQAERAGDDGDRSAAHARKPPVRRRVYISDAVCYARALIRPSDQAL